MLPTPSRRLPVAGAPMNPIAISGSCRSLLRYMLLCIACLSVARCGPAEELQLATFDLNVTPEVGQQMAYDPVRRVDELTLRCRGIVLLGMDQPVVLCAVDWIGIANESHDRFRETLAAAAGTVSSHVAVHTLHQHDAPDSDLTSESLLLDAGHADLGRYNSTLTRRVLLQLDKAVREACSQPRQITHAGFGTAEVIDVASNRRIMDQSGKVRAVRYTATRDPELRAEPVGVIDPQVSLLSFWDDDEPVAVISYYACHPQSYYRTGIPSPDFPGIARFIRQQAVPQALHVHFNGAGGNVGAGKYNDGSPANRVQLALRLAEGMEKAWESTVRTPVTAADVSWHFVPVALPPARHLDEQVLRAAVANTADSVAAASAVDKLAWLLRCQAGHQIDIGMLAVGNMRVLHMPGELFVEYQLSAKALRADLQVMMAAYGDYAPGYIGTEVAYGQGGYETSERASDVAPEVERVLMHAVRTLIGDGP